MKKCSMCSKEIINGVNGCMLMDICFTCNKGYPRYYAQPKQLRQNEDDQYTAMVYIESKCTPIEE
jgi:hypothetical protein